MRVIEQAESPLHAQMQRTFNNTFWDPTAEVQSASSPDRCHFCQLLPILEAEMKFSTARELQQWHTYGGCVGNHAWRLKRQSGLVSV